MPWWIWLLLTLFMVACLAIGAFYALRHLYYALRVGSQTLSRLSQPFADFDEEQEKREGEPSLFTQPLSVAASRYEQTHARVLRRKQCRHISHIARWKCWQKQSLRQDAFDEKV